MTRQATDQLYIELDYFDPENYYVYTAEAVASVATSATVICTAGRIVQAVASVNSTATVTCTAGRIVDSAVGTLSLFTVGVTAQITTSASTDLSSTLVLTADFDLVRGANVALETIVSLSLQAAVQRDVPADLSSAFSSTAASTAIRDVSSALTSDTTVTAVANLVRNVDSALTSEFTVTAVGLDLDLASADLLSQFTVTTSAGIIKPSSAALSSLSTQSTLADRTRLFTITLETEGFVVAVGEDLDLAEAALVSTAIMLCSAVKTATAASDQSATFAQTLQPLRIKQLASALTSASTLTCANTRLKDVFVNSARGQIIFRNDINAPNVVFLKQGGQNQSGFQTFPAVLAFYASGTGVVYSTGFTDSQAPSKISLTNDGKFIHQTGAGSRTFSGIDTLNNNHYLLNDSTLFVNGVSQGTGTLVGSSPLLDAPNNSAIGFSGSFGVTGVSGFRAGPAAFSFFTGTISQFVRYQVGFSVNDVPDFSLLAERQKLFNNGFVEIGELGLDTGLPRPADYFRLDRFDDGGLSNRIRNRGSFLNQSPVHADWKELGDTFVTQGDTYRTVLGYTPSTQDDTGPFEIVSTLTCAAQSVLIVAANLASTATVQCTATKLVGIIENFDTVATVTTVNDRFRLASADLTAEGFQVAIAVKTGSTLIDCSVVSTVTAQPRADFEASADLISTATISCSAQSTLVGASTMQATSTQVVVNTRLRNNQSSQSSTIALTTTASKVTSGIAGLQSEAQIFADAFNTYQGISNFVVVSSLNIVAIAQYLAIANLQCETSITAPLSRSRNFTVNLSAFNTQLTIGTKLTLDPYYQLLVPRELTVKRIRQETGILTVDAENRLNTVQPESNSLTVPSESRIFHIPYSPQVGTRRVK